MIKKFELIIHGTGEEQWTERTNDDRTLRNSEDETKTAEIEGAGVL